jgi:hypothetical protein
MAFPSEVGIEFGNSFYHESLFTAHCSSHFTANFLRMRLTIAQGKAFDKRFQKKQIMQHY